MSARLELKIFLSSPGDVSDERGLARRVLDRLPQEYGLRDRVHLEEVSWDDPGAPVPLDAHLTPQEAINNRRPKPSQCDVVVVILWSCMGTPLPPEHRKPDGTPYVSGTEWEYCDAVEAAKKTGKPTVLVYRRSEVPVVGLDDPKHDEKLHQFKAVKSFFAGFTNSDGSLRQSYKAYDSPSAFEDFFERELRELIQVRLNALPKDPPAPRRDDVSPGADIPMRKGETNTRARSKRVAYDLFLSYAREDQPRARQLALALQTQGWSVFWDTNTPPGKTWPKWIAEALADAHCVVVAWSEASIHSDWVYQEADDGRKRKILVPVLLQQVEPPFGFRHIQAADLIDWHGAQEEEGFQRLVHAVADILSPARPASNDSAVSSSGPRHLSTPAGDSLRVTKSGGVELVLIAGGKFLMGSPESERDRRDWEGPQHNVTVKPFYLGRYPVTNEEYARFMQANADVKDPAYWADRRFNQARQPVVGVSWHEAQRFAAWAGGRLPTEAEWEYAARAGTTTRYWWGDEVGTNNANCDGCGSQWDRKQTAPIGSFQPNAFGLHDMLGNVWEWVQDCWHQSYEGGPMDGSAWEEKPGGDCARRVVRGGSWYYEPRNVRSAFRFRLGPDSRNNYLGFRLAHDLD